MENKPICEIDHYGNKRWYLNGNLHREDGPAIVDMADGRKEWWINGNLHREDGPAIIWADGDKEWWINGKLHRLCGTAIDYNGRKEWYINDHDVTQEITKWATDNNIDLENLTEVDIALIKISFT